MVDIASNPPEGTPTWVDLGIPDLARAEQFYGAVFGWRFEHGPPEAGGYTMCLLRDLPVAAVMQNPDPTATSFWWNLYLAVDDCDAAAQRATEAGARVVMPPDDVMDAGRMAILIDPVGAQVGLWQGRAHVGARIVNEPGSLVWNELVTAHAERARDFYASVFGYVPESIPDPDFDYTVLNREDGRPVGGIEGSKAATTSSWRTYFEVADVDATVTRVRDAGGECTAEPADSPYGRLAGVRDPFGADFHVMRSAPAL